MLVVLGLLLGDDKPAPIVLHEGEGAAIVRRDTPSGPVVRIEGDLAHDDAAVFADAVAGTERALVSLHSSGGSVRAALAIGRAIHARGDATFVANGDTCLSACGLIWLAGATRLYSVGADVGFHAAYATESGAKVERGAPNALIGAYLAGLGHSERLVWEATRAAPDDMVALSPRFFADTGVLATQLPRHAGEAAARRAVEERPIAGPAAITLGKGETARTYYGAARWTVVRDERGETAHIVADLSLSGMMGNVRVSLSRNTDASFDAALLVGLSASTLAFDGLSGLSARREIEDYVPLDAPYRWEREGTSWLSLGRRGATAPLAAALRRAQWFSLSAQLADGRPAAVTFAKGANWTAEMNDRLLAAL